VLRLDNERTATQEQAEEAREKNKGKLQGDPLIFWKYLFSSIKKHNNLFI
jgi:hypothetical protein